MKNPYSDPQTSRIDGIFFPYLKERSIRLAESGHKLAYYTSASTAVSILKNREVWMRNVSLMNDYSEVQHGLSCLKNAYVNDGAQFRQSLDEIFPSFADEVAALFNSWQGDMRYNTYVTCISEHPLAEHENGRLSMWRAYGQPTGVALVFKPAAMFLPAEALLVHASPVAYWSEKQFAERFRKIGESIKNDATFVKSLGRERVRDYVFSLMRFAALCTKHPGFEEEQEWRAIASPRMYRSPHLTEQVEVIGGIPQKVMKFPFRNDPTRKIAGLEIPELLESIIIGPCDSPLVIRDAFVSLLRELTVPDPEKKVIASRIPLRNRH